MIQEEEISFDEIEEILKKRNLEFFKDEIYIMPEASEENSDILNEYTPDIHKFSEFLGWQNHQSREYTSVNHS